MIWFLSTAAIAGYVAVRGLLVLRAQRGYRDFENSKQPFYMYNAQQFKTVYLSQGCQVRHAVRLPPHGMGSSLSPILPHESPVIPASLSPRPVFCHPTALRYIRLYDVNAPSTLASPDRGGAHNYCHLEFLDLQPAGVWGHVDERGMPESSVVENLGLQLVRVHQCVCCCHR